MFGGSAEYEVEALDFADLEESAKLPTYDSATQVRARQWWPGTHARATAALWTDAAAAVHSGSGSGSGRPGPGAGLTPQGRVLRITIPRLVVRPTRHGRLASARVACYPSATASCCSAAARRRALQLRRRCARRLPACARAPSAPRPACGSFDTRLARMAPRIARCAVRRVAPISQARLVREVHPRGARVRVPRPVCRTPHGTGRRAAWPLLLTAKSTAARASECGAGLPATLSAAAAPSRATCAVPHRATRWLDCSQHSNTSAATGSLARPLQT